MNRNRQGGAVLIVTLILLMVVSMLVISGTQGTLLDERMAGGYQDRSRAFNAAEAALRGCERLLQGPSLAALESNDMLLEDGGTEYFMDVDWASDSRVLRYTALSDEGLTPACIIQRMAVDAGGNQSLRANTPQAKTSLFMVTARGVGLGDANTAIVQSTYRR